MIFLQEIGQIKNLKKPDQKGGQKIEQKNRIKMGKRLHKKSNKKSWTINRTKISDKKSGNKSNKKMGQKIRQKIGQKIRQINRSKNWAENRTKKSGKKSDENSVKKSGKKNRTEKIRQRNLTKNRTKEIGHLCSNPVRTFFFWMGGGGRLTLTVTDPKVPFWLDSNFEGLVALKQVLLLGFRYRRGSQLTMQAWCNGRNRDMRLTEGTWVEFPSFGMFYLFKRDLLI